jgi:hypothetical protein
MTLSELRALVGDLLEWPISLARLMQGMIVLDGDEQEFARLRLGAPWRGGEESEVRMA